MGLFSSVEAKLEDKLMRKAMMQREVELSIGIAKARDSLMWFGGLYSTLVTGVTLATIAGKHVPPVAAVHP